MEDNYIEQTIVDHEEIVGYPDNHFDVEESCQIRSEQDQAFEESLKVDREKVVWFTLKINVCTKLLSPLAFLLV